MSKEPFDHIEDRIREAAENSLPAFNGEAWAAMNTLLDKEYERKPRRRIFLLLVSSLTVLMLATVFYFFIRDADSNRHTKNDSEKASPTGKVSNLTNQTDPDLSVTSRGTADETHTNITNQEHQDTPECASRGTTIRKADNTIDTLKKNTGKVFSLSVKRRRQIHTVDIRGSSIQLPLTGTLIDRTDKSTEKITPSNDQKIIEKIIEKEKSPDRLKDSAAVPASVADSQPQAASKEEVKAQQKRRSSHGLYIAGYGGADNNSTGILNNGITTVHAGIGVGYRLNDRISLQTGFYAGKKKYKAGAGDYYVKPGSYLSTVDITQINADCDVFEMPLAVRYDLLRRKNYFLYGMVSSSSYIMKKEYYNYHYIKNGTSTTAGWDYTGNRHLFSVVGISLGYEQKISERFSLLAEPYIKGPLSGIGEGKVKLYSAGLLLGAKFNLFK